MAAFEYSIFGYEDESIADELRVIDFIEYEFRQLPRGNSTLYHRCATIDEAAEKVQEYRAMTCGSAYNIALINLIQFPSVELLEWLLSSAVLGDPWTAFVMSLRGIDRSIYSVAREKVEREAHAIYHGDQPGAPSCIDSYSRKSRQESAAVLARILTTRLDEEKDIVRLRKRGKTASFTPSPTEALMRKSKSTYCGIAYASQTGILARLTAPDAPAQHDK
jgi:hypothetical protein